MRRAFFDINVDNEEIGRIEFELRDDVVPKTVANFLAWCNEEAGNGYKGTRFYRIIPRVMLVGGDITENDGTGGVSIYGNTFEDENFKLKHDQEGVLSMENSGPDTNRSQFIITTAPAEDLDWKNVVFGYVSKGMSVVKEIEFYGNKRGEPVTDVMISNCGELTDY